MFFFLPDTPAPFTTSRQVISRRYIYNPHFVESMREYLGDTVEPIWSAEVGLQWIGGLPSVVVIHGGWISPYASLCRRIDVRTRLRQWLPHILPYYIERLTAGEDDPDNIMRALLTSVNTQLQAWRQPDSPLLTFDCALTWHCSRSNTVKVAAIGVGQGIIAIYREQTGQYDLLKPSVQQNNDLPAETGGHTPFVQTADIQPGDTLLALTEGAFRWLDVTFENGVSTQMPAIPLHQLYDTNLNNAPEYTDASERGFDASMAQAVIPPPEITERIKAHTLEDIRQLTINRLHMRYPDGLRIFGRRHNQRREAICDAIRNADLKGIQSILLNQYTLTQNLPVSHLEEGVLDERWSQRNAVRNPFAHNSLYKAAIASTYRSFLENAEDEQEKPPVYF